MKAPASQQRAGEEARAETRQKLFQIEHALTMTSSTGLAVAQLAGSSSFRVPIVSGRRTAPYSAASSAAHPVSVKGARSPDTSASSPPKAGPISPPSSEAACAARYSSASCLALHPPMQIVRCRHSCAQCHLGSAPEHDQGVAAP